jgi:hypothetical protein
VSDVTREVPDNTGQADEPIRDSVGLGREPFEICRKLGLLVQQKLHRPFDFLRGHRLKLHDLASSSVFGCHYAIVGLQQSEQGQCPFLGLNHSDTQDV